MGDVTQRIRNTQYPIGVPTTIWPSDRFGLNHLRCLVPDEPLDGRSAIGAECGHGLNFDGYHCTIFLTEEFFGPPSCLPTTGPVRWAEPPTTGAPVQPTAPPTTSASVRPTVPPTTTTTTEQSAPRDANGDGCLDAYYPGCVPIGYDVLNCWNVTPSKMSDRGPYVGQIMLYDEADDPHGLDSNHINDPDVIGCEEAGYPQPTDGSVRRR